MRSTDETPEFNGPMDAAYSPDGSKILYNYRVDKKTARVVVRDAAGSAENILLTLETPELFAGYDAGLTWAQNDVLYLPGSHLLLNVGAK
jgi:hypothetical protein